MDFAPYANWQLFCLISDAVDRHAPSHLLYEQPSNCGNIKDLRRRSRHYWIIGWLFRCCLRLESSRIHSNCISICLQVQGPCGLPLFDTNCMLRKVHLVHHVWLPSFWAILAEALCLKWEKVELLFIVQVTTSCVYRKLELCMLSCPTNSLVVLRYISQWPIWKSLFYE